MSAFLQCVSSGSQGNCYILSCNYQKLILELGVSFRETLKAINFDIASVVGCLVSHRHKDHSISVLQAQDYGLQVYSNADVASIYPNVKVIETMKRVQIGGFKILPIEVPHGDCPNTAFHITMPDGQTILFATDLERLPYSIKGISHLVLECNYSNELILDSLVNGDVLRSQSQNHLELEECIATVKRLRHGGLQSVILCHLSNGLSDEKMFKDRFESELGITPLFAERGKIFPLESCEF